MRNFQEQLKKLYKVPWTACNNPNGWIEPTTYCQLKCPGCYRGLCDDRHRPEHFNLDEIKKQVDFLIEKRNVQNISIAGGEPLLYPYLDELINYISSKGINIIVLTNGILLTEKRLHMLKKAGLNNINIHIDKFQKRKGIESEHDANLLRAKYCDLFRKVGGFKLGFIMPISKMNLPDIEILAPFLIENSDIIEQVSFTVYKAVLPEEVINPELAYSYEQLVEKIRQAFGLEFCAYIGKTLSDEAAWMYATTLYRNGRTWGSFTPEVYKNLQETHIKNHGKYLFEMSDQWSDELKKQKIYRQTLTFINPPDSTDRGWNICDGCPDAMYYQGKLIPSCLWERVKAGEDIQVGKINKSSVLLGNHNE